jgi:ParB family chromosome partitioning protein
MSNKTGSASKIKMESFDDLFGGNSVQETGAEQIINAPLADLYEFKDHPFKVLDDEKMEETTESIRLYGVLVPGIARPRAGGGYELIAGHRRKHGSERAGKTEMPIIVRNYSDDEATIIMVDSNIQREDILPSEKAKAYKMKYEAMKHQGKKSGKNTLDEVGEAAGENAKKVQRYIWLARLSEELLEMVDTKRLGFSQGVDISFLTEEAQQWVEVIIEEQGCNVSTAQSGKLKEYGKSGELTLAMVRLILTEEKPKERKFTMKSDKIGEYFSDSYSNEEIENIIISLLDKWKKEGAV